MVRSLGAATRAIASLTSLFNRASSIKFLATSVRSSPIIEFFEQIREFGCVFSNKFGNLGAFFSNKFGNSGLGGAFWEQFLVLGYGSDI